MTPHLKKDSEHRASACPARIVLQPVYLPNKSSALWSFVLLCIFQLNNINWLYDEESTHRVRQPFSTSYSGF